MAHHPAVRRWAISARLAPGDVLLQPLVLASIGVLIVNDRWLKPRFGPDEPWNMLTGKLSDVAGLFSFPLIIMAVVD